MLTLHCGLYLLIYLCTITINVILVVKIFESKDLKKNHIYIIQDDSFKAKHLFSQKLFFLFFMYNY